MRLLAALTLLLLTSCQYANQAFYPSLTPAAPSTQVAAVGDWPQPGVAEALAQASIGNAAVVAESGATLEVTHEYFSALHNNCRVYSLTGSEYLACGGPDWKPVRKLP